MATCKDCLHVDICKFKDLPAPLSDTFTYECECIEKRCPDFKEYTQLDKLMEPPYRNVYYIENNEIIKANVSQITIKSDGKIKFRLSYPSYRGKAVFEVYIDELGVTTFFTQEEAEAAMKESETK